MRRIGRTLLLAPAVLVTAGGCFASRSDIKVLQQDLAVMRAESARADSVRRSQLDSLARIIVQVNDSVRTISARVTKMSGDVRGDLYSLGQQVLALHELTGQSTRRVQEMRAALEARQATAGSVPVAPGDTSTRAATTPGPNQLFQMAQDQLRRGSTRAARIGFTDLLTQYPNADVAGEAQYYLGESYRMEGNPGAADSVYLVVLSRYPQSPRAGTALYKHAQHLEATGKAAEAKASYERLVRDYPRSDEAVLARERLRGPR